MALDKITTGIINDDAVTAAKIVAGAVEADIRDDAITGAKLANDIAITTTGALTGTTGDFNWDSNTLVVDSSASRVGIGTASPGSILDIRGTGATYQFLSGNSNDNDTYIYLYTGSDSSSGATGDTFLMMAGNGQTTWNMGRDASDSGKLKFTTGSNISSGTARMTIDTSGSVGIGTASPATKLHIVDTSAPILRIHHDTDSSATSAIQLMRGANDTFGADAYTDWQIKNEGGELLFQYEANSGGVQTVLDLMYDGKVGIGTDNPSAQLHAVLDSGTTRASSTILKVQSEHGNANDYTLFRILNSEEPNIMWVGGNHGNIGMGRGNSDNIKLYIEGQGNSSSDYAFFCENSDNTNLLYVRDDGYMYAQNAWNTSDRRRKENISYITDDILPKIENLKFAKFDMIGALKNCYGFIAQDVETLFPDCIDDTKMPDVLYKASDDIPEGKEIGDVKEEGEEQKNLNYNYLFSHLVKAVQELSAKVTALENA